MKKFLSIFLIVTVLFTCVSCGRTEPTNADTTTTTENTVENTSKNDIESSTLEKATTEAITEDEDTTKREESCNKEEASETITKSSTTKKDETTIKSTTTKKNETTTKSTTTKKSEPTTKKSETTTKKSETTKTTTTKPDTPAASVVTNSDIAKIKSGFLRLVNEERARVGVKPLRTNSALTTAANYRSYELLKNFSHTRPNGQPFYTILNPDEYSKYGVGENIQLTSHMGNNSFTDADIFVGRDDQIVAAYAVIFNNFKKSQGHYENMIYEEYIDTGIGISYKIDEKSGMAIFYVCQIFGSGSDY